MYIDVYEPIDNETEKKICEILGKNQLNDGIEKYIAIQTAVNETGKIDEIKDGYTKFYKMTKRSYDDDFICKYFSIMKDIRKHHGSEYELSQNEETLKEKFTYVLGQLHEVGSKYKDGERNKRYEMSFTSKLLHTVDPSLPIWDSEVATNHFKFRLPSKKQKDKAEDVLSLYYEKYCAYRTEFEKYMNGEGQILIKLFNKKYGEYKDISNAKKIDFILWQDR